MATRIRALIAAWTRVWQDQVGGPGAAMNNVLFASLSLMAIVSTTPAVAAVPPAPPAPLRAWTLGDYAARDGDARERIAAATRAQGATIDENGVLTYRDPIGAPTRIAAPLTVTDRDKVLLLADMAMPGGRGGIVEGGGDPPVVGPAFVGADSVMRGSGDRVDLRSLTDITGLMDVFTGPGSDGDWQSRMGTALRVDALSPDADPRALISTLADAGGVPRLAVSADLSAGSVGMAATAAQRVGGRPGIVTRTGSVRALPQSVNGGVLPEPTTWATMIVGFALIGLALRRKTVLRFV